MQAGDHDHPGLPPQSGGPRVRDLLRRCGRTRDRRERAALLSRLADELDQAASRLTGELAAGLRGQASMARFLADLDLADQAYQVAGRPSVRNG